MGYEPYTNATSDELANFIQHQAETRVVLALPSIHGNLAKALLDAAPRLGNRIAVVVDPTENVYRLGFGTIDAISSLMDGRIPVLRREGIRLGCALIDDIAFFLAPSAHLVEAESETSASRINAVQVHPSQAEAYLLSIAEHPDLIQAIQGKPRGDIAEPKADVIHPEEMKILQKSLQDAPPANFPLARQTRVFQAHMQYVEIELNGCNLGRRRFSIPKAVLPIDSNAAIQDKLEATISVIPESLEQVLRPIRKRVDALLRKGIAKNLGGPYGCVLLISSKPNFEKEVENIRQELAEARASIQETLELQLEQSKREVGEFCLPHALKHPPQGLLQMVPNPSEEEIRRFVEAQVDRSFPVAVDLLKEMSLSIHYKDLTFETLNRAGFLDLLAKHFPHRDWEKAYQDFVAVKGEETASNRSPSL